MTDTANFLLYSSPDGNIKVEVFIQDETVWLTQKAMAELFGVKTPAISKHLSNIFETGELEKEATISILETVQSEEYPILEDKGKVSALEAKIKAEKEYEEYRVAQDKNYISDFDKEIKRIMGKNDKK